LSRIGLLVPSSNTTVEAEFYLAPPKGVTLHAARLFLTQIATDSIANTVHDLETQSRNLAGGCRRHRAARPHRAGQAYAGCLVIQ